MKFKLPKTKLKRIGYNDIRLEQFDTFMATIRLGVLNIINKFSNNIFEVVVNKNRFNRLGLQKGFVTMFLLIHFKNILNMLDIQEDPILYYDSGGTRPTSRK